MVNPLELDALTEELQRLRAAVVRDDRHMADRLRRAQREARRLGALARGTAQEAALQSVENLLHCLQRGLTPPHRLPPLRRAS